MRFSASELAAAVDGTLHGPDVTCDGAGIDSRELEPGMLFVPVVAERDGHDFIPAARGRGAACTLSSRPGDAEDDDGDGDGPVVIVEDTVAALGHLGAHVRRRLPDRVVGITGSVGKTSVKDLTAAALATRYPTSASLRSFNNELGVPLTLINAPEGTEAVVVEMGARGRGHIASLCPLVLPTVGIITTVGAAHTELFGSVEEVAVAKGELVEALPADGTAVLNADHPLVAAMATRTEARVLLFGDAGEVRASDVHLDADLRPRFRLHSPWGSTEVALEVRGEHNVTNALAAAAAALALDVDLGAVAEGLSSAQLSPWRMAVSTTADGAVVINDAYNANPLSMASALRSLAALSAERRIAVVGLMAELGATEADDHRAMAALAADLGIDLVAVATDLYGVPPVADREAAFEALGSIGPGDAVLVKGSRVAGLEHLAERLVSPTGT